MQLFQEMLSRHPQPAATPRPMRECVEALFDCAFACTSCADACLAEGHVAALRRCIRLNLDSADLCAIVARAMSRQTEPDWALLRIELEACATLCEACARECDQHAALLEHCRVCAQACRQCRERCLRVIPPSPSAS